MKALISALLATLLITPALAATGVTVEKGNVVVIEADGKRRQVTDEGQDSEPVLAPDGASVVFTRTLAVSSELSICASGGEPVKQTELWSISADGTGAKRLAAARADTDMEAIVCDFHGKQFDSAGTRLYYETRAWTTSNAVRVVDLKTGRDAFFAPGSGFWLITCSDSPYVDHIAVEQHRYFIQGGSYDWYFLFDPSGKEIGTFGEEPPTVAEFCGE